MTRLAAMGVSLVIAVRAAGGADYQPGTPFTWLFDTGAPSPQAIDPRAVAAKTGWTVLAEDDLTHPFTGDVVLSNDKLTVVFRRSGSGAEVYSQTPHGPKLRAVLLALPAKARSAKGLTGVKILENNPAAVMAEVTFGTDAGRTATMRLRLTTGQPIAEIRPGDGADRFVVWDQPEYLVVPDFFADDMVFGPGAFDRLRHGLPSESLLLHLLDGGNAMAVCVWKSGKLGADALLLETDGRRQLAGCEIQCARDEPIWVALLEGPKIWWRPPFPAQWRADSLSADGTAESRDLEGVAGTRRVPSAETETGTADGTRRVPATFHSVNGSAAPLPAVVYPIDRRRDTPLTALTPIDVLRNTLGVGPCQYILQVEGLAGDSDPTPAHVMDWIEKQFARKKDKESADRIAAMLKQMIEHVERVRARIEKYAQFAREVKTLCGGQPASGSDSPARAEFAAIARNLEQLAWAPEGWMGPAQRTSELAEAVAALVGKENAPEQCRQLGTDLRELGAFEDRTLSKCRMSVRWLKQKARARAVAKGDDAELAAKIQAAAERVLQTN
jgi:hypothetical protein